MNIHKGNEDKELPIKPVTVAAGITIQEFSEEQRMNYAAIIYAKIKKHPHSMRQISIPDIMRSMATGKFVFILGQEKELLACSQIWSLPDNHSVMECGTWLSFLHEKYKGTGAQALSEAVKLALLSPETKKVIAIVEQENTKAQQAIKKLGGKIDGNLHSIWVSTHNDEPAPMFIFDITALGRKE